MIAWANIAIKKALKQDNALTAPLIALRQLPEIFELIEGEE